MEPVQKTRILALVFHYTVTLFQSFNFSVVFLSLFDLQLASSQRNSMCTTLESLRIFSSSYFFIQKVLQWSLSGTFQLCLNQSEGCTPLQQKLSFLTSSFLFASFWLINISLSFLVKLSLKMQQPLQYLEELESSLHFEICQFSIIRFPNFYFSGQLPFNGVHHGRC